MPDDRRAREDRQADSLKKQQLERESTEQHLAVSASDEQESAQHQRRAEKAGYLRRKLEERAETERKQ